MQSMAIVIGPCKANVIWPPRSCDLTPLRYYLRGAVKDKCYADKLATINGLKGNIHEAIGEMQLHTIDNVLKNWTDGVGRILLSNKKRNFWENIQ